MPKKTAYSRSGAQRNRTKQKSFELVRPGSGEKKALATVESSKKENITEVEESGIEEKDEVEVEEVEETGAAEEEAEEKKEKVEKVEKRASAKVNVPETPAAASTAPKSAAARMAARRQTAQKSQQRSMANLILAENYAYVRKDLVFILILAIIMFSAIIALHFIVGS